jgi:hypothetical protein
MIDVENYFKNFTPKFNEKRYYELFNNPPTLFNTPKGRLNFRKELVKSVLAGCKLLHNEFDRNNIYYGEEGSGKSHTVFQHTYLWWWCLKELGMINYEFGLHLVYGRVQDIIDAFDKYKDIPYMLYVLDESEELNRKNWNSKLVKQFMGKLRRERKNLRVVNLILPALEEILPSIALSRVNWIVEVSVNMDEKLNVIRGKYSLLNIPLGYEYYSPLKCDFISRTTIKRYLNERFYNKDRLFERLPFNLLAFTGTTNKVFVFDKQEYREWAKKINIKAQEEEIDDRVVELQNQRNNAMMILREKYKMKYEEIGKIFNIDQTTVGRAIRKMKK